MGGNDSAIRRVGSAILCQQSLGRLENKLKHLRVATLPPALASIGKPQTSLNYYHA